MQQHNPSSVSNLLRHLGVIQRILVHLFAHLKSTLSQVWTFAGPC